MPGPVTLADVFGNLAGVGAFGTQLASVDPQLILTDTFDGTTSLDTVNRWTASGSTTPSPLGNGFLALNPGTAALASSVLVSQAIFAPSGYQIAASYLQIESPVVATGNHRFFGMGIPPAVWTASTPIQDGFGFEIDTLGVFRGSQWAGGVRQNSTILTFPTDGLPHLLIVHFRPGAVYFSIDNPYKILASATGIPQVLNLPLRTHSLNGAAATVGTPTMSHGILALVDYSRPSSANCDGTYSWRKQTVFANGAASVAITQPAPLGGLGLLGTVNALATDGTGRLLDSTEDLLRQLIREVRVTNRLLLIGLNVDGGDLEAMNPDSDYD
jgi:hypothetical protein